MAAALLLLAPPQSDVTAGIDLPRERTRVLAAADKYLREAPITVTAAHSSRSAGGPHVGGRIRSRDQRSDGAAKISSNRARRSAVSFRPRRSRYLRKICSSRFSMILRLCLN